MDLLARALNLIPEAVPPTPTTVQPIVPTGQKPLSPIDMIPVAYVTYLHTQRCTHCNCIAKHTETFIRFAPLSPTSTLREFRPVDTFLYNIEHIVLPTPRRTVPTCHECVNTFKLDTLPSLGDTAEWKATVERKRSELTGVGGNVVRIARATQPSKPKATLADVFKSLGV